MVVATDVVADGGSTKCDWLLVRPGRADRLVSTRGFNPFYTETPAIEAILQAELLPTLAGEQVRRVWFYGTGIHDAQRAATVCAAILGVFNGAEVVVEHDLLGAARAVCGQSPGIACILGTGSNSCLYDGQRIIDNVPSLGWLLGDEGSGSHLGRLLLRAWFYREMPSALAELFDKAHPEGPTAVKDRVYGPNANAYVAAFSHFVMEHAGHPWMEQLVKTSLNAFLDAHVIKYEGCHALPVHFVGSVAHHYAPILVDCLQQRGMLPGSILQKPIFALRAHHLEQLKNTSLV
jgi:N-acetylglucosamine kinase-like BadF-type ATPase